MAYKEIITDVADNILTITLNRPDKLNAFTGTMMHEMIDAFQTANKDDAIRCVIVTASRSSTPPGRFSPTAASRPP